MSGENSKNSGELGEYYVNSFLKLIGWSTYQAGQSIGCDQPAKHKKASAKKPNSSHGIDVLYTYESPMDADTLIHSVMSVKHLNGEYPSLGSTNREFKKHLYDLAYGIECFIESELISQNRSGYEAESEQVVGVLFWLSSGSNNDASVISQIKNPELKEDLLFERIHVIDNDRVEFITQSIGLVKNKFPSHIFNFYYIDTPNNLSDRKKEYSGDALPVEMLSSDIQVFKLQKDKEIILAIVLKDSFDVEGLKRVLGLAHRLTNNLTSNVAIFYPHFEEGRQDNQNTVSRVKSLFKDKAFINSTYVYGYKTGFKKTTEPKELSENIPNEELKEQSIDNGKFLPYGEHLRSLLSHSVITTSEIKHLLRDKGIFVCEPSKENTIPILTSMLLSPNEFDILKEKQKTKEDREKRHSSKFKVVKEINLKELKSALKSIDLNKLDKLKIKNYKYKTPQVSFKLDEEKKELALNYEIERYQRNKSWDEQTNFFDGSIIISFANNDLEILAKNIATSNETLSINQSIINHVKSVLVDNEIISKTAKEEKILMSDMSNEESLQFLLSFTNNNQLSDIEFIDLIGIDIEIDDKITLPDSSKIKWMESKIKKLKIDGTQIEDTEILTDVTNHKYLKCWGLTAKYKYDNIKAKGSSTIEFKYNDSNKGEFFIQVAKLTFDKKLYSHQKVEQMILEELDRIKYTNTNS